MDECWKEEGGISHICSFLGKIRLSWKAHSRSLLMPYWPEQVTGLDLTVSLVERKYLAFLASIVEGWEWGRGWGMGLGWSYFIVCHTFPCTSIKKILRWRSKITDFMDNNKNMDNV